MSCQWCTFHSSSATRSSSATIVRAMLRSLLRCFCARYIVLYSIIRELLHSAENDVLYWTVLCMYMYCYCIVMYCTCDERIRVDVYPIPILMGRDVMWCVMDVARFDAMLCCAVLFAGCVRMVTLQGSVKNSRRMLSELQFDFPIDSIGTLRYDQLRL